MTPDVILGGFISLLALIGLIVIVAYLVVEMGGYVWDELSWRRRRRLDTRRKAREPAPPGIPLSTGEAYIPLNPAMRSQLHGMRIYGEPIPPSVDHLPADALTDDQLVDRIYRIRAKLKPVVAVICDRCGATLPTKRPTPAGARSVAQQAGWAVAVTLTHGAPGHVTQTDLCPACNPNNPTPQEQTQ